LKGFRSSSQSKLNQKHFSFVAKIVEEVVIEASFWEALE